MAQAPEAWQETALVSIALQGGTDVQFATLIETVDFDIGDKDVEGVALISGGRVMKWSPQADSTVTFEAYPIEVGTASGTTGKGFFDLVNTVDSSYPLRVYNDHTRNKYRILFLQTNDTTVTTAQAVTTNTFQAQRIGMAEAYFTSVKPSFTDGIMKWTVTAKCGPFDKANTGTAGSNIMMESCMGTSSTDVLPAIAAYTTSNKFG